MAATTAGVKRPFSALDPEADAVSRGKSARVEGNDLESVAVHSNGKDDSHNNSFAGRTSKPASTPRNRSREHTPVSFATHRPSELPAFAADASVVLMGIRGSGKSTLAIIASVAMKRGVIDCEKEFIKATGSSSSAYKKNHSPIDCHRRQADVLRDVLTRHSRGWLVVCSWMERAVQGILRDFCHTNPVIHILRDTKAIREHLKIEDDEKTRGLLSASSAIFRGCSNLEFFNISESPGEALEQDPGARDDVPSGQRPPAPYLTLKRAERHFLKFLSLVMPAGSIPFIESAFPLASIPTEDRRFTYALSVPLCRLINNDIDIEDLETGADAIEIVIDDDVAASSMANGPTLDSDRANDITRAIGSIRRSTVIPIIYHVVLPAFTSDTRRPLENVYMEYILHGLRLAPEYLTIDMRLGDYHLAHAIALKRRSKMMAHFACAASENRSWKDPIWMPHYHRARSQGCDLVRLIKPVSAIKDNFDINRLKADVEALDGQQVPLIAYNSGSRGRHSASMNHVLTSVTTEPLAYSAGDESNEPRITAKQATQALYGSFLFDAMKLYVVGAKVDYSLSPAMHNAAFKALGIPHYYRPHSTPSLRGLEELIQDPYFAGASVGLPFKVEIIPLTHSLSRHARAIGAVNTLIPVRRLNPDGSIPEDETLFNCRNRAGPVRALYGDNTDWVGIRACLRRGLSPANAVRPTSCGLVIGAGGMARAAVYSMLQLGVKNVVIHNRTASNAQNLVDHFTHLLGRHDLPLLSTTTTTATNGGNGSNTSEEGENETQTSRFHIIKHLDDDWPADFRKPTMIVFCIPTHSIGDVPAPNFTAPPPWFDSPTGGVLVDLGYKTLNTPILDQARALSHRGWVTMDGLDLLPEQGFAQFELFTGRRAPRRLMRRHVLRAYTDEQGRSNLAEFQPRLNNITEQEP